MTPAKHRRSQRRQRSAPITEAATRVDDTNFRGLAIYAWPSLVAILIYLGTLDNDLVYDDRWTLDLVDETRDLAWIDLLRYTRGLTYAVHRVDRWIWGEWTTGFHLTNLLLHGVATGGAVMATMALTASRRTALFAGLLFAVHPVHVEAVASIAYRKDLLAMVFVSAALALWTRSRGSPLRYVGSMALIGLGMISKEVAAIGAVPMLLSADLMVPGDQAPIQRWRAAGIRFLPMASFGVLMLLLAAEPLRYFTLDWIQDHVHWRFEGYRQVLATAIAASPTVVRLALLPTSLSADYPTAIEAGFAGPRVMAGALVLASWVMVAWTLRRRSPTLAFGVAWALMTYLPSSNFVPLTEFFVADRYLYVPSFGVCLAAAVLVDRWLPSRQDRAARNGFVAIALLLCLMGLRTMTRVADWDDSRTLWSSAIDAGYFTPRVHTGLGASFHRQGDYDDAIEQYRIALALDPFHTSAGVNLGVALATQGKLDEAIRIYRTALEFRPADPTVRHNLGIALAKSGDVESAIVELRQVVGLAPELANARYWLGSLLGRQERYEASIEQLSVAVRLMPENPRAHWDLGLSVAAMGDLDRARRHLLEAARLDPNWATAERIDQVLTGWDTGE